MESKRKMDHFPPGAPGAPGAPSAPARKAAFNVMLSDEDYARLDAVAHVLQRSRGAVVREAVRYLHQMIVQGVPTCASGAFCPVPQMHRPNPGLAAPPSLGEVPR